MKPKSKLILHAQTPPVVRCLATAVGHGPTAVGRRPTVVDCG